MRSFFSLKHLLIVIMVVFAVIFGQSFLTSISEAPFGSDSLCQGSDSTRSDFMAAPPQIAEFWTEQPSLTRVGRELSVLAVIANPNAKEIEITADLIVPDSVQIIEKSNAAPLKIKSDSSVEFRWRIKGLKPDYAELKLEVKTNGGQGPIGAIGRLPVRFLASRKVTPSDQIPAPVQPERTSKILVGAHNCPLWNADSFDRWSQLEKHPERTPALGFYNQQLPEVADWETKWAAEHGVDFFIYCWYRACQGKPVETRLAEAIHEALYHSQYQKEIKFTIMWENQNKGSAGVANEEDLLKNVFPYWVENYFKKDNYLKIDNKPLLFIYRPEFLINDLGSVENVHRALDKIRAAAKKEGFNGLWILGEYRGTSPQQFKLMKDLGLDYSFAYCWHISNSPSPAQAIDQQLNNVQAIQETGIIPQIVTASQAWSGWSDEGSIWKLPPEEFEVLLRRMKSFIENKIPSDQLGSKMIILDNWNEWGEGHYLLPYTEYGFEYLDAIANVFTKKSTNHEDLLPGDLGKGNYDVLYRQWRENQRKMPVSPDRWSFDKDAEGWKSMMGNSSFAVKDGKLCIESKTKDPAINYLFKKYQRAERFSKVRIRMKVSGLKGRQTMAQFLWIQNQGEDWSEKKSVRLPLIENDQFNDYVFELKKVPSWRSQIAGIRFDYASLAGVKIEIDEITFEK